MKRLINFPASLLCAFALLFGVSAIAANLPSDWQRVQSFDVSTTGLVKMSLPIETLDAARPELEDLRLYDEAGNEVPVFDRTPHAGRKKSRKRQNHFRFRSTQTLQSSRSKQDWRNRSIASRSKLRRWILSKPCAWKVPRTATAGKHSRKASRFFASPYGASHLQISLPPAASKWLRLTVDDGRSPPVPFTGALVHPATGEPAPGELIPATITERDENPGETRLALSLGAANLSVASVQIETSEPLFMREVSIACQSVRRLHQRTNHRARHGLSRRCRRPDAL